MTTKPKKNPDGSTPNEIRPKSKSELKREAAQAAPASSAEETPKLSRMTKAERAAARTIILQKIKLKRGATSADLIAATRATAGQVRGILETLIGEARAERRGSPKASTYHAVP